MADSPLFSELLELNKDLERMTEDVENISVHLTWMAYDMVMLRTSPELMASMLKLNEVYQTCRAAFCGDVDQDPELDECAEPTPATHMENTERSTPQAALSDLENILKGLGSLSNCMDQLALRAQLRQCDLIVSFGHPDKMAFLKVQETLRHPYPQLSRTTGD